MTHTGSLRHREDNPGWNEDTQPGNSIDKENRFYKVEEDVQYTAEVDYVLQVKRAAIREVADKFARKPILKDDPDPVINQAIEIADEKGILIKRDKMRLAKEVRNEALGYGPIEKLINDTKISEIMVNGPYQVKVEYHGILMDTDIKFDDNDHVKRIIDRIVSPIGRHIDEANPMVDGRLPDGSRVNAIIPPISLKGPCITIRKFSAKPYSVKDLISFGTMSETMAEFLEQAVLGRMNILVSGGTGAGKTTLLNVLSSFIPDSERIITIEDSAELRLQQNHVLPLESRTANIEGAGQIEIRDLVRNSLRMRPDRIIVGEVRSRESIDMLQAMNTGHDGSLTTIHANSPRDALSRVETTALMSDLKIPVAAIRTQAASAFDLIVHIARMRDGTRKITSITDVCGISGDIISTQEIFKFVYDTENGKTTNDKGMVTGHFEATGVKPSCCESMINNGAYIRDTWFWAGKV